MSQPQYTHAEIKALSNQELARALSNWATARCRVSRRRVAEGKEPLDAHLLREAALRLTWKTQESRPPCLTS